MKGVYLITNLINGYQYVGESINIHKRWQEHKTYPFYKNNCKNKCPKLYSAIRKYGINNFEFKTLIILPQESTKKDLWVYEEFYIWLYDTFYNGYNCTPGGKNNNEYSESSIIKIKESWTDERKHTASIRTKEIWKNNKTLNEMRYKLKEYWKNENIRNVQRNKINNWIMNNPEYIKKRSEEYMGGNNPNAITILDITTNIEYSTATEAAIAAGSKSKRPDTSLLKAIKAGRKFMGHNFKIINK